MKWTDWRAGVGKTIRAARFFRLKPTDASAIPKSSEPYETFPVDIVIAFDTTASFLHMWAQVDQALNSVLRELGAGILRRGSGLFAIARSISVSHCVTRCKPRR